MRRHLLLVVVAIGLLIYGIANGQMKEDVHLHKECKYCGMDRGMFDFTRMLREYDDGKTVAVCSIHGAGPLVILRLR